MGNCCCGPNPNESCGYPPGTIRSLIAILTIVLTYITGAVTIGIMIWYQQYTIAVGILGTMFSIIAAVIGHYFGQKAADSANGLVANVQQQLIDSKNAEVARLTQTNERMLHSRGIVMNPHFQNRDDDHVIEIGTGN